MIRRVVLVQPDDSKRPLPGQPSYTVCIYIAGTEYLYENLSYRTMCGLYNARCGILQYIRDNSTGKYLR